MCFFFHLYVVDCCPVRINLKARDTTNLYKEILDAFNFPYNKIKEETNKAGEAPIDVLDEDYKMDLGNFQMYLKVETLPEWLSQNIDTVKENQESSTPWKNSISNITYRLHHNHGIKPIIHNFKLNYASLNSLLTAFERLLLSDPKYLLLLKNRSLILSNFTGLDHIGRFSIDFRSPPEDWRKVSHM